jgi:dinuclear metal center YbgI/SA1388 family protein
LREQAAKIRVNAATLTAMNAPASPASISRADLSRFFDQTLEPARFKDYCPNGLQVEGKERISKLISGVTASEALIDAAIAQGADAILVHHGLFWRNQDGTVRGWMKQRLQKLLAHDINVYAFHLPLDAHPILGNNAQLGKALDFEVTGRFGEQQLGFLGRWTGHAGGFTHAQLHEHLANRVQRPKVALFRSTEPLRTVAWCTGGAQGYFEDAIAAGADVYITGEISEPQTHVSREMDAAYFACGHHATERGGAMALGEHVARELGLAHQFIDIDNPA